MKRLVTYSGEMAITCLFVGNKELDLADSSSEAAKKAVEAVIASEWQEFLCALHRHGVDITTKDSEVKIAIHNVSSAAETTVSPQVPSQGTQHQP